jgi:molecular chaperone GrpE
MSQPDGHPGPDRHESAGPSATGQGNVGAPADADPAATLDADLTKLQEERDALFQQLARVQADFRNARQRLETEKQLQVQYANGNLIKSLLPAIDNLERALEVDPAKTDVASLLKGMAIVRDQLLESLRANRVRTIAPEPGTPFDPNEHEALLQQPSEQYAVPTVVQLLQKGYALNDRVLRAAQVAVSKAP